MDRITALRHNAVIDGDNCDYQNVACIRTNAMKHLPNFFVKKQLRLGYIIYLHFLKEELNLEYFLILIFI